MASLAAELERALTATMRHHRDRVPGAFPQLQRDTGEAVLVFERCRKVTPSIGGKTDLTNERMDSQSGTWRKIVYSGKRSNRGAAGIAKDRQVYARRLLCAMAIATILVLATTERVCSDVLEKVYTYSINHPKYGRIGTYINRIIDDGGHVAVNNEIDIKVKVFLAIAHSEKSKSKEIWKDGRLISFYDVTKENGQKTVVTGKAEGSRFIVDAPDGEKEAPAGIFPNNPWSKAILKAPLLLGTKTGKLYKVHAKPPIARDITLGDRNIATEYVRVLGDKQYQLWFDNRGIAVQFAEIGDHGVITFKLVDESTRHVHPGAGPAKDRS